MFQVWRTERKFWTTTPGDTSTHGGVFRRWQLHVNAWCPGVFAASPAATGRNQQGRRCRAVLFAYLPSAVTGQGMTQAVVAQKAIIGRRPAQEVW